MKFRIIKIGRPAAKEYVALTDVYRKRLRPLINYEEDILKSASSRDKSDKILLEKFKQYAAKQAGQQIMIGLDETGVAWSSVALAEHLRQWSDDSRIGVVSFVVGDPYGLSQEFKQRCDHLWSLSKSTLPSDLAWLILWEQLYRAQTIIRGQPYHHA